MPNNPSIYHIVHVDRLASIVATGGLLSDARLTAQPAAGSTIGMGSIKQRRLNLPVKCYPGDTVGQYVPFYFCSRSVMLFVIHCANNPELAYRGGQGPIVHLEANLTEVIHHANANGNRWAVTPSNAGAVYTAFYNDVASLSEINWNAVASNDFRSSDIKEAKQAEFLMRDTFPWHLIRKIGVRSTTVAQQVANVLMQANHRPAVEIRPDWYY